MFSVLPVRAPRTRPPLCWPGSICHLPPIRADWLTSRCRNRNRVAHRIIDRPIQPCDESPGCPGSCILRVCQSRTLGLPRGCILRRLRRRISASCLASSALQLCRRWFPGLPRVPHPSAVLALITKVAPGSRSPAPPPGVSARLPRLPHLPALPAMEPRVAPRLASFGDAAGDSAGCPASSLVSLASWRFHRVAPASAPSGSAGDGASGCPASRILQRCCFPILRVAPRPRSSASPPGVSTGLPRLPRLPAVPEVNLRVAPNLPALWRCRNCVLRLP